MPYYSGLQLGCHPQTALWKVKVSEMLKEQVKRPTQAFLTDVIDD